LAKNVSTTVGEGDLPDRAIAVLEIEREARGPHVSGRRNFVERKTQRRGTAVDHDHARRPSDHVLELIAQRLDPIESGC
jgi:hypothetical protein